MGAVVRAGAVCILDEDLTIPVFDLTVSSDSELDISPGTWRRLDSLVVAHMLHVRPGAVESANASADQGNTQSEAAVSSVHIVNVVGEGVPVAPETPHRAPGRRRKQKSKSPRENTAEDSAVAGAPEETGRGRTVMEMLQSDTKYGRRFSCRRALRLGVADSGAPMLFCSQRKPEDWHTRVVLTPQQVDGLDLPRVLMVRRRMSW